ncbi:DUF2000 domain-containing protein [Pseudovibrio sp. Ad37]|uniref:DUF2000 domain-containing protein n=1 Tax=Pseudovibrio sp. Ad37 TaxID=989422 RepID=UPI0007AE6CD5|nr:DUF2000 domain-containing protein [Pseudovibrio sp. Ad37]KZL27009.1 hypothetical protein PsAD37_01686 [Pseudovibrio sp. Ad37]
MLTNQIKKQPLRGEQDLRLAIVADPDLPTGLLANTVGAISIGIGTENTGLAGVTLTDREGVSFKCSADRPVPILQANVDQMQNLLTKSSAHLDEITLVVFPTFARSIHSFAEYDALVPTQALKTEKIDGIGICGPSKLVRSLVGALKLLR